MAHDSKPTGADVVMVRQTVRVILPPDEAFRLFTEGINEWWPLDEGYSYGGDRAKEVFLEPIVGGRFYERFVDGDELQIGTVTACSPPDRILFTWMSPGWTAATEVDVRFRAAEGGTTVELEHRGFEKLGPDGRTIARKWGSGWPRVIQAFADRAARR
jgi:uncharacterized protein YndB with AHSA1/START domain